VCEINGGKMDGYIKGCFCSDPQNFAVADTKTVSIIHEFAQKYALADRYFQPTAGASSMNDMYFARAHHVYKDNEKVPTGSIGTNCNFFNYKSSSNFGMYYDPSITTLLDSCNLILRSYAEGYEKAKKDFVNNPCYPYGYDSGDIPYLYYGGITDNPIYISDYTELKKDIEKGELPDVSFVKPLGMNTGHPSDSNITNEMNFIKDTVEIILNSKYYEDTLIVWVPDESGGFYDHISPPDTNIADGKQYGPRIPFLAMGKFAKKNYVSHVTMEHSSLVKFIEWNWLNGETGQLNTRDKNVNSIGDLVDPNVAGRNIP
jgi:phospholipase C